MRRCKIQGGLPCQSVHHIIALEQRGAAIFVKTAERDVRQHIIISANLLIHWTRKHFNLCGCEVQEV